jgi:acetate kinase
VRVLLLNAGSSTLKSSLLESDGTVLVQTNVEITGNEYEAAVRRTIADLPARPELAGHRIVHGGGLTAPVRITDEVHVMIAGLVKLAPLHNPAGLATLAGAQAALPDIPHVAVFDTAFHATMPAAATTYPVPFEWTDNWSIRRYGFHGLSHLYSSRRAPELVGHPVERLVVCHLGRGCSACAILRGRSIDTTMGFTPLDGLMMGTRSGSIDPGIITHVQQQYGLTADEIEDALNRHSGLLGVSGISPDMREVLAAARTGEERAELAVGMFVRRVRQAIGALTATLGGIDALVFTAGIGEHSAEIREAICRGLGCLGLELDPEANTRCRPDCDISAAASRARILVVVAREDLAMLGEVLHAV